MASYGKLANMTVERRLAPAGATAERALLILGGVLPSRTGAVSGSVAVSTRSTPMHGCWPGKSWIRNIGR
jgi:hypothetical protein